MIGQINTKNIQGIIKATKQTENWIEYILDTLGLIKNKTILYKIKEKKYLAEGNTTDRWILTEVVINDNYNIEKIKEKNLTIIDIGGHAGYFSLKIADKAKKIYTYEPNPKKYNILKRNIMINNLEKKITAKEQAVGKNKTKKILYLSEKGDAENSTTIKTKNKILVDTTTIPEIFERNKIKKCDILKMDIEGGEYEILYNLPNEYFKRINKIIIETHEIDNKRRNNKELNKYLKKVGYRRE